VLQQRVVIRFAAAMLAIAVWSIRRSLRPVHAASERAAAIGPVRVLGNADAIADAVRNLVENAVHQSPAGGEVAVTVSREGTVSVADRGPGVPEADRQRIFERFWRGRGVTRQGAGLGLAIVAEIAKAHGGSIEVADRPGGGALFALRIPLA
jgi:signal transduction histidine kinase